MRPTHAMTRSPRLAITSLALWALGSFACSFSFKSGSSSAEAGKPGTSEPDAASKPTSKPIAKTDSTADPEPTPEPSEPVAGDPARTPADPTADPTADPGPSRVPPRSDEPAPVVDPQRTAVCRIDDATLAALCHQAFDPIAADDLDGWLAQLGEGAVLTRPAHQAGMQRLRGADEIRKLAVEVGGLRSLVHLRPTDRVVGTVSNDCRGCRRAFVAFEANTRSGTVVVTYDMRQPPRISTVEVASQVRRRHLGTAVAPKAPTREPTPTVETPSPEPSAKPEPKPTPNLVAPEREPAAPTRKKPQ